MSTLSDEESDPVWLFMDDNQNIYSQGLELPGGFAEFELTWNCGNTQAIHREVAKLYRGDVEPEAIGPEGRSPELHLVKDHVACVGGVLERLIAEEGVPQTDIVILSSHALAKSDFAGGRLGSYALAEDPAKRKGICSHRSGRSRDSSHRWSFSREPRTSTTRPANSSSTSGCLARATTA